MALNPSGIMSIGGTTVGASINLELGLSATANSSIGQANFRELAKVPTGAISLSDFYGKADIIVIPPITENTSNYVLSPSMVPGYVAGQTNVQITISTNIYIYSTDINTAALTLTGFAPGDEVTIVNSGYIMGKGGTGGQCDQSGPGLVGIKPTKGGTAISTNVDLIVNNQGYIGGGGGGGDGGGGGGITGEIAIPGGGGAGGGDGGGYIFAGPVTLFAGAGGLPGQKGSDGTDDVMGQIGGGGGGGRIFPGTGGTGGFSSGPGPYGAHGNGGGAGGGGSGMDETYYAGPYLKGGQGGIANNVGSSGESWFNPEFGGPDIAGAGGGGWGASGGIGLSGVGGAGGKAIALNGNQATLNGYVSQIYGGVS